MIEIPESYTLSKQLNDTIKGKIINKVNASSSKHKFAFYYKDPDNYNSRLTKKEIKNTKSIAGYVEIIAQNMRISFNDGVNIRFYSEKEKIPTKHQLHIEFTDNTSLVSICIKQHQQYVIFSMFLQHFANNSLLTFRMFFSNTCPIFTQGKYYFFMSYTHDTIILK